MSSTESDDAGGAVTRIATGLGISTAAVSQWRRIPPERLEEVARIMEVTPQALLPTAPTGAPR